MKLGVVFVVYVYISYHGKSPLADIVWFVFRVAEPFYIVIYQQISKWRIAEGLKWQIMSLEMFEMNHIITTLLVGHMYIIHGFIRVSRCEHKSCGSVLTNPILMLLFSGICGATNC